MELVGSCRTSKGRKKRSKGATQGMDSRSAIIRSSMWSTIVDSLALLRKLH
jgi:hypothetical protein